MEIPVEVKNVITDPTDERVVAVDSGKYATKVAMKDKGGIERKEKFRTKMDFTREDATDSPQSYVVEYEGKRYLIGNAAESIDYEKDKAKDIHKLSTYLAVSHVVPNNTVVNLIIGCPLDIYYNVEERKSYSAFMKGTGDINISVNGRPKHYNIKNVMVCPEGSGVIYKNPSKYKDDIIGVIDIGGLNVNGCVYDQLTPTRSTHFTNNMGANVFLNELRQELNSTFKDANIQEYLMESVLRKGYIKTYKEESQKVIKDFKLKHLEKILDDCVKKGWDLKNMDIVFVGGGSALFAEEIKQLGYDAPSNVSTLDMENVLGFLAIGGIKYEKR